MMVLALAGWLITAAASSAIAVQAPSPSTSPPVATGTPEASVSDIWLVIYNVQPARVTEFEAIARRVQQAMRQSPDDRRRRQADGLRIHRSALPNPEGNVVYFVQVPTEAANEADRTGLDVLIDAVLPAEATALRSSLDAVLDPRNPSGNTLMLAIR